ncbi:hypothetical protein RRG08_004008 [Elysia crispata]|uniref:Uncharacterized protein n=1 Tax=Elysia crispata TaxID=231223 RepID=A0AAE0Y5C6_9GAST|nr:hypothetical protein RRG08_004008 [Elysia crispata]
MDLKVTSHSLQYLRCILDNFPFIDLDVAYIGVLDDFPFIDLDVAYIGVLDNFPFIDLDVAYIGVLDNFPFIDLDVAYIGVLDNFPFIDLDVAYIGVLDDFPFINLHVSFIGILHNRLSTDLDVTYVGIPDDFPSTELEVTYISILDEFSSFDLDDAYIANNKIPARTASHHGRRVGKSDSSMYDLLFSAHDRTCCHSEFSHSGNSHVLPLSNLPLVDSLRRRLRCYCHDIDLGDDTNCIVLYKWSPVACLVVRDTLGKSLEWIKVGRKRGKRGKRGRTSGVRCPTSCLSPVLSCSFQAEIKLSRSTQEIDKLPETSDHCFPIVVFAETSDHCFAERR